MASVLTAGQNRLIKPGRTVFSRALSASPSLWRDLYTLHPLLEGNKGVSVSLLDWRDVVSGRNPTTFVGTTPTWNLSSPGFVSGNASSGHHRVQFAHGDAIWGNGGSVGSGFMYVNEQGAAIDNGFWSLNGNIDFLVWHDAVDKLTVRISGSVYGAAPSAWPLDSKWHTLSWSLGHGRFRAFVDGAKHLDFASTVSFPTSSGTAYPGYGSDATGRAHTNQYAIAASWSRVLLDQEHRQLAADPFALIRPRDVVAIPVGAGPATVTPTVVDAVAVIPQAVPQASSTVTPAAIAATTTLPQAVPVASSTSSPTAILATVNIPQATAGAATSVSPAAIAATVTVPQAVPTAGAEATPAAVVLTAFIVQATLEAAASVTPTSFLVTLALPAVGAVGVVTTIRHRQGSVTASGRQGSVRATIRQGDSD